MVTPNSSQGGYWKDFTKERQCDNLRKMKLETFSF